jgi:hypothetical protein
VDRSEAREILAREIEELRRRSYAELRSRIPRVRRRILFIELVDEPESETHEVTGQSGTVYQVQTEVFWDGKPERDIRVTAMIDDGGAAALKPMADDFIIAPDGSFVGE